MSNNVTQILASNSRMEQHSVRDLISPFHGMSSDGILKVEYTSKSRKKENSIESENNDLVDDYKPFLSRNSYSKVPIREAMNIQSHRVRQPYTVE